MENPTIPLDDIHIGSRFRKEYGDIDQLAYSIKKNGLISPIAVGLTENLSDDLKDETEKPYTLLAGGRRISALRSLGWTTVPVRLYDQSISSLDLRSIELAENLDRKDMTYAEELKILNEIDKLQKQIHGEKIGRHPSAPGWSQADTAKLTKKSAASVANDLKLAKAIEEHPELQLDKCKNKHEAMKRLKKAGKTISDNLKAEAYVSKIGDSSKIFTSLSSAYVIANCFDMLAKMPDGVMDLIEIDPPYAIDLTKVKRSNECDGYNEIDSNEYEAFMTHLFSECYRVMKTDSWLICWFGPDPWFGPIAQWLKNAKFNLRTIPGIWTKTQGQTLQPELYLASSYEMFFYARKGNPKIQNQGRSNIFNFSTVSGPKKYHPTQRPLDLMTEIYSTFCGPNSTGFIPFLGSGVGILAGHSCKIKMIGTDISSSFRDGFIISLNEYISAIGG